MNEIKTSIKSYEHREAEARDNAMAAAVKRDYALAILMLTRAEGYCMTIQELEFQLEMGR